MRSAPGNHSGVAGAPVYDAAGVAARLAAIHNPPRPVCACGGADNRACVTNGEPCHWVAPDLCSARSKESKHG